MNNDYYPDNGFIILMTWQRLKQLQTKKHSHTHSQGQCTFNPSFVRSDGSTLNSNMVFLSGQGRVDGDLVVSLVTVGKTEVIVLQFHVDVGQDELWDHRAEAVMTYQTSRSN